MASRRSPAKVTLAMMKGKPIATSVPSIRYHASDDELEELYPSTDDEKQTTPESEKGSSKSSPCKSPKIKSETPDGETLEKRSSSVDGSFSEGTPPTDPWKMFSDFRGKLTKTFEEKLSEIKSEKKSKRRSRESSSVSDSEDLGDVTPTEDFVSEKQEKDSGTSGSSMRRRGGSSRFASFSSIKTGLKTKNCKEDSVESGIEAAELAEDSTVNHDDHKNSEEHENLTKNDKTNVFQNSENSFSTEKSEQMFGQLKRKLFYRAMILPIVLLCSYYVLPLPDYFMGFIAGIVVILTIQKSVDTVRNTLIAPVTIEQGGHDVAVSFVEISAIQEHAVLEKFEGWLNELPYDYAHDNYHVARTKPVFFKLEGDTLRIMESRTRVAKRAAWNEGPIVPKFTRKRVCSLKNAKIELLPDGLTRRRRWSKKYPICVTFGKQAIIESMGVNSASEDEAAKTDSEKETTILEEDESEREDNRDTDKRERDQDERVNDDDDDSKTIPKSSTNDVFADCRDDGDDDDEDEDVSKLKIYVFARTDRQKEEWYRRLVRATTFGNGRNSITSIKETTPSTISSPSTTITVTDAKNSNSTSTTSEITCELSYNAYMSRYIDAQSSPTTELGLSLADNDVVWLNALLGRVLFDMHKSNDAINLIQEKIQRKLSNIKLPYFMQSVMVTELVIGQGAPVIHKATKPILDERGLSVDLDITYEGCLTMTIETKLNLMKLTRAGSVTNSSNEIVNSAEKPQPARSPMFDSDVEDSPETSTEEEDSNNLPPASGSKEPILAQSSGRKFLSMIETVAANRYFQHAAELSCVRRAMEGLSKTEIRLQVNVSSIKGCLTVNIPPPPSDRIWYGFKPVPSIILTAKPAVGEMAVNIGYVTKWIETKLLKEFERVVVLPNMDDVMISLCPNYPFHDAS